MVIEPPPSTRRTSSPATRRSDGVLIGFGARTQYLAVALHRARLGADRPRPSRIAVRTTLPRSGPPVKTRKLRHFRSSEWTEGRMAKRRWRRFLDYSRFFALNNPRPCPLSKVEGWMTPRPSSGAWKANQTRSGRWWNATRAARLDMPSRSWGIGPTRKMPCRTRSSTPIGRCTRSIEASLLFVVLRDPPELLLQARRASPRGRRRSRCAAGPARIAKPAG